MKTLILNFVLLITLTAVAQKEKVESIFKNGEELYNNGAYDDAIKEFTNALKVDSTHMNSYLRRGACYIAMENYKSAIRDFSTVIKNHPNHTWAYISRGSAYNKIKEYKLALDDFNKAISLDPENQEAYNNRGWSKKFLGDKDGACADWKQSKKMGNSEAKIILKNNNCN